MKNVALIIGAGAFGTSIASVLANNFDKVVLMVRSKDIYDSINSHENKIYLPGQKLSENISAVLSWDEFDGNFKITDIDLVVNGLPTSAINSYYNENKKRFVRFFENEIPLVSLSKGIDPETLELSDDLFDNHFSAYKDFITFLSGPSFAKEIVDKQVTTVSLAGKKPQILIEVCEMLATNYFKAFPTYDVKGVLLGGALKNILAIAGGILEGLGFNHNTRAAMITRGITEMLRFGSVLNARPETFYSFAGMGDLILTTTSSLSRNKTFGLEIAKGRSPKEIIESQRSVVEGYKTTRAAYKLAKDYNIRAPLFTGIYEILYNDVKPQDVLDSLMSQPISSIV
ncbi:MAG: NAD(P)-dependent glycerol-3-phosphate dehydrogenase [Bacteriovoracaceae bacterium]|jgi:glycerol-3-phosphate dehydrogenase (NAD(P)+)|nr:NAD(P)-dependent glycerol-3-phosphate dehydrogenase [Bacteriovoracaceae bacterium]